MKRQSIRSAILVVSLLLFPLTQFYFSPYLIVDGAIAGIVAGSAIVFAAQFLGALFVGRAFCGWIMPCGGLQEACFAANRRPVPGGRLDWIKWFLWIPWISSVIYLFVRAGGVADIDPFRKMHHGISVAQPWQYWIFYGVTAVFVVLAFSVGRRAACHYLCWMSPFMIVARFLRNRLRLPALQLTATGVRCTQCDRCSMQCPMSLNVKAMLLTGELDSHECILCASCVDACKKGVLRLSFGRPLNPRRGHAEKPNYTERHKYLRIVSGCVLLWP